MGSNAGHAGQESSGELKEVAFKVTLKQGEGHSGSDVDS